MIFYLLKYDAKGSMVWAKQARGTDSDEPYGIIMDDAGNIYMTGYFSKAITIGTINLTSIGIFSSKPKKD